MASNFDGVQWVDKYYVMDPETDDLISNADMLRNGMVVLIDNQNMRVDLDSRSEDVAYHARIKNRWCKIEDLTIYGYDEHVRFTGVYFDGIKAQRSASTRDAWLVKKDSIPDEDDYNSDEKLVPVYVLPPNQDKPWAPPGFEPVTYNREFLESRAAKQMSFRAYLEGLRENGPIKKVRLADLSEDDIAFLTAIEGKDKMLPPGYSRKLPSGLEVTGKEINKLVVELKARKKTVRPSRRHWSEFDTMEMDELIQWKNEMQAKTAKNHYIAVDDGYVLALGSGKKLGAEDLKDLFPREFGLTPADRLKLNDVVTVADLSPQDLTFVIKNGRAAFHESYTATLPSGLKLNARDMDRIINGLKERGVIDG
jgi:hypothetical protein